ncbi:MAG: hypothetical protein IJX74_03375 [Clostridia bacterium]|nr:hypothetical protein [Clostridia bacterium]
MRRFRFISAIVALVLACIVMVACNNYDFSIDNLADDITAAVAGITE